MTATETADFFLEILTEEMPAGAIPGARADLVHRLTGELTEAGLPFVSISTFATPRRLIALVRSLAARQPDRVLEVSGPPVDRALDAAGRPTNMAEGFARAQGVEVAQLLRAATPRGEVLVARKTIVGRPSGEILSEAAPRILKSMSFPKMMRWGAGQFAFVRPVHRVVALLGSEIVPFELFGIPSGRLTEGHRLFSDGAIPVDSFEDYLAKMRANGVEPDGEERCAILLEKARAFAAQAGGTIEADADLVRLLADLVEWPGLVRGSFDPVYLDLPEEILVTTLRTHQKYLPIRTPQGPTASFVAVMDNREDRNGLIAKGNEWVINARLSDARFFFDADVRERLSEKLPRLSRLAFHEKLGDYLEKSQRLEILSTLIGELVTRPEILASALTAARLAKVDLTTEMVREFPDLQGIVGGLYARREGFSEDVWKAIYDQYRPASAEDSPPRTETGAIVSMADRFDTLAGFFRVGLIPTGSKDPYALRRAAQGIILIAVSRGWRVDWLGVARKALALHSERIPGAFEPALARLQEFFADRVRFLFEKRGLPDDVISAVLAGGSWDFADLADRARALAEARRREDFRSLSLSVKRIRHILAERPGAGPDASLYREESERDLANEFSRLSALVRELMEARRYPEVVSTMTALASPLDRFFTDVLVNAPEPDLRRNRHALLAAIDNEFSNFADISLILVEK